MSEEEDGVYPGQQGQTEIAEQYTHPKLREGFIFRADISDFTLEEKGRDSVVTLRVATSPDSQDAANTLYIEIVRESDIYYVATSGLTEDSFPQFRKEQKLRKAQGFNQFIQDLLEILKNVNTNRTTFRAVYNESASGVKLDLRQQLEFKNVIIFSLNFTVLDRTDKYVKDQAQFRYQWLNHEVFGWQSELARLLEHIRGQNPALAQQLEKGKTFAQSQK
jgi:hypothetical protein